MRTFVALLLIFQSLHGFSQSGFSFPQPEITFTKDITFGTVHGYLEIKSDTTDTLPMVWIARKESNMPIEWIVNFDDQSNYHPVVESGDQDTFDLLPNTTANRKLIIGLAHNSTGDTSSIFFTVYPINSIEDSAIIEYKFQISKEPLNPIDTADTSTSITEIRTPRPTLRQVSSHHFSFDKPVNEVCVFDPTGRILIQGSATDNFRIPRNTRGLIVVHFQYQGATFYEKVILKSEY